MSLYLPIIYYCQCEIKLCFNEMLISGVVFGPELSPDGLGIQTIIYGLHQVSALTSEEAWDDDLQALANSEGGSWIIKLTFVMISINSPVNVDDDTTKVIFLDVDQTKYSNDIHELDPGHLSSQVSQN